MEKTLWHHERESTRRREAYFLDFAEKVLKSVICYLSYSGKNVFLDSPCLQRDGRLRNRRIPHSERNGKRN